MLELYQKVILKRDIPDYQLQKGDIATLIDYIPHPSGGEDGYILEIFNAGGESIGVITVAMSDVQPLPKTAILTTR